MNILRILLVLVASAHAASAADLSWELGAEARLFPRDGLDGRQHGHNSSLYITPELFHDWGDQRLAFAPYLRWDQGDDERTQFDLRELYWRRSFDSADLYVGVRRVFWGVTESLHLVDIINQSDLAENLDGEDKLGQAMLQLTLLRDWGTLDLFVLPHFRERRFPGTQGRLRGPAVAEHTVYETDAEEWNPDLAARWSHILGDFDIGLGHFYGTSREPRFAPSGSSLAAHYDLLHQSSLELQYIRGDWLGKLEAVRRDGIDGTSLAAVGGFEYTQVGILGTNLDLGWVGEYQYDDRGAPFFPVGDNDIALGARLTFNDVQDTNVLFFAAIDTDKSSRFGSLEAARRMGTSGTLRLEARFFANLHPRDPLAALRRDDYAQLEYVYYF